AFPERDMVGDPAPFRAQAAGLLQAREEGVRDERIGAVVQGVPRGGGDLRQAGMDPDFSHAGVVRRPAAAPPRPCAGAGVAWPQASLSRNRSASSAAMQPKPAEVIACRQCWSVTSPAANTPGTEVAVALPPSPERILI